MEEFDAAEPFDQVGDRVWGPMRRRSRSRCVAVAVVVVVVINISVQEAFGFRGGLALLASPRDCTISRERWLEDNSSALRPGQVHGLTGASSKSSKPLIDPSMMELTPCTSLPTTNPGVSLTNKAFINQLPNGPSSLFCFKAPRLRLDFLCPSYFGTPEMRSLAATRGPQLDQPSVFAITLL